MSSPHLSTGQEQEDTDLSNDSKDLYNSEEQAVDETNRPRTVMTSDAEVANGFVKNGTSLPYVFETNESGNRKRASKILPVCGLCGKKFVCVTTMKRHLVTHTGEKPFSCIECGKNYTQKGNLRVHERTHRNDRPFECNICHQKFYRKEPMQKHQWRQHAIGHYKQRNSITDTSSLGIIGAEGHCKSEGVLYNSLIERIKTGQNGGMTQKDHLYEDQIADPQNTPKESVNNLFEHTDEVPEPSTHTEIDNFSEDETSSNHSVTRAVNKYINEEIQEENIGSVKNNLLEPLHTDVLKSNNNAQPENLSIDFLENVPVQKQEEKDTEEDCNTHRPMKLKMKLAQAYMREVKENREREERDSREREGRDSIPVGLSDLRTFGSSAIGNIEDNLSDIQLSVNENQIVKLTMDIKETPTTSCDQVTPDKESVECQCKACGSKCYVSDPYNFSCQNCNVKYTSLPTHIIADPLQCIGCMQIFAHKPAMKAHQSSADKKRPFICCKCGFEFKQKAHLQKHQWRIHRRKLEPDPNVKEAEAIMHAVSEMTAQTEVETQLTIQQIIDRGVEREIKKDQSEIKVGNLEHLEGTKPLDLSPSKMYGSANSITQWVQQVETARTPIIPDISIHKKPIEVLDTRFQEPQIRLQNTNQLTTKPLQFTVVPPVIPRQEGTTLTIQLLEPKGVKWPTVPLLQPFAVKSKPITQESNQVPNPSWRNNQRDENPLLNQISSVDATPVSTIIYTDRANKRPRTDLHISGNPVCNTHSHLSLPTISTLQIPMTLVHSTTPNQIYPTDMSTKQKIQIEMDISPPSPPLNLSKDFVSKRFDSDEMPFDYRIGRSDMISGQLKQLKNQDERSGISM